MSAKTDSLLHSVSISDLSAVRRFLDTDDRRKLQALFNEHDDRGRTPIHIAASLDNIDILQELINAGADVNVQDYFQQTPVFEAVLAKQINSVHLLVDNRALIETENNKGYTPIFMAAKVEDAEILQYFCEEGVDVNKQSKKGLTPLSICALHFWIEGLDILGQYGAKYVSSQPGAVPILQPVFIKMAKKDLYKDENALKTVQYLIGKGATINLTLQIPRKEIDENGDPKTIYTVTSPLQQSISSDYKDLFEILLKAKPPMNQPMPNQKLPLQQAVEKGLTDFIQPLIDAGSDLLYLFEDNQSYLHIAATAGKKDAFDELLAHYLEKAPDYDEAAERVQEEIQSQKEANKEDNRPDRPIVLKPTPERFDKLRTVDPFYVDKNGNTALICAAKSGCIEIVEELIDFGCDPAYENKKRYTAYTVATTEDAEKIIELANKDGMDEKFEKMRILEPYHDKFDKPKPKPSPKNSILRKTSGGKSNKTVQLSLTQKTAQLEEKKSLSPPQSPVARPWGGSIEAEEFRRKTRIELRNLRQEMKSMTNELKDQVKKLYEEFEIDWPESSSSSDENDN